MIVAGIDTGYERLKVVLIDGEKVLGRAILREGANSISESCEFALSQVIEEARLHRKDIGMTAVTGAGRRLVHFVDVQVPEPIALCKGMEYLLPSVKTIIDIGAHKTLAVRCQGSMPITVRSNGRCASGSGRYLEMAAELLGVSTDELAQMALGSTESLDVQNACMVFAESEIITLIHTKKRVEDIARAMLVGLAERVYSLLLQVGVEQEIAAVGGVARNQGFIRELQNQLGSGVLVPEDPDIVGALGAALLVQGGVISR